MDTVNFSIPNNPENVNAERGDFPQGVGAASAQFGYTEAQTQTHSSDPLLNEQERAMDGLRPEDRTHKVNRDEEVDARAQERYDFDYEGEKADLFRSGATWGDQETALAHRILETEVDRARQSGDYAEVVRLMKEWDAHGTEAGQAMRQRARFSNTPEMIVAEAAVTLDDISHTRRMTPEQRQAVLDSISDAAETLDGIQQGDMAGVIEMIQQLSAARHTTGLFARKTSRQMAAALDYMTRQEGGETFLRDVAASQIRGIAQDCRKLSVLESVKSFRYMNMLSKASTVLRNLVGNNVFDPVESVSQNIAVPLDILLSKFTGTRSVAVDRSWISKEKRHGSMESMMKSFVEVGLDADVSNAHGKYETGAGRNFRMSGNFVERLLSTFEKYQSYALTTTDQMQKGGIQAETQRGIDALERAGKMEHGALDGRAEEVAKQRTFQNDGATSRALTGARRAANSFALHDMQGGSFGLGDLMIPFANVPANIAAQAANYTPAGMINGARQTVQVLMKAKNGTLTAAEQAQAVTNIGRGMNGTAGIALFTWMALKGLMNVAGDDDKDKESLERSEGLNGTQLNLSAALRGLSGGSTKWQDGDDLMSIGFLDPINAQMTFGSMLADAYTEDGTITPQDVALSNVSSVFQSVMELPALQQIQELSNGYKYSDADTTGGKVVDAGRSYLGSQATSFLVPNLISGIAQGTDGTVRDTYSGSSRMVDSLKSKVPGLRQTLPAALDNWGNEKQYTGSPLQDFLNANLLPGSITKYDTNPVNQELARLYDKVDVDYPGRRAPKTANRDEKKVELTAGEQRTYQKTYGQTAYKNARDLLLSQVYKQSSDAEKAEALSNIFEYSSGMAKSKVRIDGGGAPAWATKSEGSIADNAVYRALLGTAKQSIPKENREKNGYVMEAILGKVHGSDEKQMNVMAQKLEESTLDKVREAYDYGYSLDAIVDFYKAKNEKSEDGKSVYKKKDGSMWAWARENGYSSGDFAYLWKLFAG